MRKIGLQPLGTLAERFCKNWLFIGCAVVALCAGACSDDDDNNSTLAFPQKQTLNCNTGDNKELTFDAATNWQLTSSATWCRFVVDGTEEYSTSGSAGTQTITLKIGDESLDYDAKTVAKLTLLMGGQESIIAEVVRNAQGRELHIYDADGNEIHEITVGYDSYQTFQVKANFSFAATNRPEWLDIEGSSIVGSADKMVKAGVRAVTDNASYYKYAQNGTLTFADDKGLASYDIPLVYAGMSPTAIRISTPTTNIWNWTVSLDGKTFTQAGTGASTSSGSSSAVYKNYLPFTVTALNDDFVPVYAEKFDGQFYFDDIDWLHLIGEKGNMNLKVDEKDPYMTREREGYVFVFPRAEYETIKDDLEGNLISKGSDYEDAGEIVYKYTQQNLLIQVTQKEETGDEDVNKSLFTVKNSQTATDLATSAVTNTFIQGDVKNYFNTDQMEQISASAGMNIQICPLMSWNEWDGSVTILNDMGESQEKTIFPEPGEDVSSNPVVLIRIPADWDETYLYVGFKGVDGTYKKVLVIAPQY